MNLVYKKREKEGRPREGSREDPEGQHWKAGERLSMAGFLRLEFWRTLFFSSRK